MKTIEEEISSLKNYIASSKIRLKQEDDLFGGYTHSAYWNRVRDGIERAETRLSELVKQIRALS